MKNVMSPLMTVNDLAITEQIDSPVKSRIFLTHNTTTLTFVSTLNWAFYESTCCARWLADGSAIISHTAP